MIALSKIDLCPEAKELARKKTALKRKGYDVAAISAVTGAGMNDLMQWIISHLKFQGGQKAAMEA